MHILLLSTYPYGGAGTACQRLQAALRQEGHEANLLTVDAVGSRWPFYAERLSFLPRERDKSVRFYFSPANFGHNIVNHPMVQKADILHLHWINQGFLSLENIAQLASTGKPIVWTLHDMWAFTGGCHYSGDCRGYEGACGNCLFLRSPGERDFSNKIWQRKAEILPRNIQYITCSNWLAEAARRSSLLGKLPILSIPNAIDTHVFKPSTDDNRAAFKRALNISENSMLLLFAAMRISEERKGFRYLHDALHCLKKERPDLPVELLIMGQASAAETGPLPYPSHRLGMQRDVSRLVEIYGAADAFIIPSLEDNLPNTVMESLACGTPVIGFDTGGIPEMVGHLEEGFIAPQRDSAALSQGIQWLADSPIRRTQIRLAARQKAERHYSSAVVASQHLEVYRKLLG